MEIITRYSNSSSLNFLLRVLLHIALDDCSLWASPESEWAGSVVLSCVVWVCASLLPKETRSPSRTQSSCVSVSCLLSIYFNRSRLFLVNSLCVLHYINMAKLTQATHKRALWVAWLKLVCFSSILLRGLDLIWSIAQVWCAIRGRALFGRRWPTRQLEASFPRSGGIRYCVCSNEPKIQTSIDRADPTSDQSSFRFEATNTPHNTQTKQNNAIRSHMKNFSSESSSKIKHKKRKREK